jgi:hypothetical protein
MASHREVAHAWAHQTGKQRNGHNLSYEGARLYSYSTCIARLVEVKGETVVFLTASRYSMSTSRHMRYAIGATSHMRQFTVPFVDFSAKDSDNHQFMLTRAESLLASSKRRRDPYNADSDLRDARAWIRKANEYAALFDLDIPPIAADEIDAMRAELSGRIAEVRRQREEQERKRRENIEREQEAARVGWLAGASVYFHGTDPDGGAYLRVRGDTLETSQGASVPLAHAVKAFQFVKRVRETGNEWHRNGHTLRVGHFMVDHVASNGDMRAGCHFIKWAEIERVAKTIGADNLPADDDALILSREVA